FFRGEVVSEAGLKDITWVTPAGIEATADHWSNPQAFSLGYVLCGAAGEFFTRGGQRDIDESFLVMMNAFHSDLDFGFPQLATPMVWEALVDTAEPSGLAEDGQLWSPGEAYRLRGRSFALFINRAPESPPGRAAEPQIAAPAPLPAAPVGIEAEAPDAPEPAQTDGDFGTESF
ncbi:MAG TPA: hypothetical protein VF007_02625, partial [Stellaceae bacterium]